jgi:hypothetical protein
LAALQTAKGVAGDGSVEQLTPQGQPVSGPHLGQFTSVPL